ncbi:hypothetical protein [Phormidium sp. CCY1219]|uniref:hypothetical protein n=1 Tax=Phormidium sp. CCY1219 TaxID=2886104 RepID=UPI002D1F8F8F|nr:hypothetical protein [Phormidium sp. CCY1219]MEB3830491.1 hypothetical protein [Phormidium sp. CCY1219]
MLINYLAAKPCNVYLSNNHENFLCWRCFHQWHRRSRGTRLSGQSRVSLTDKNARTILTRAPQLFPVLMVRPRQLRQPNQMTELLAYRGRLP